MISLLRISNLIQITMFHHVICCTLFVLTIRTGAFSVRSELHHQSRSSAHTCEQHHSLSISTSASTSSLWESSYSDDEETQNIASPWKRSTDNDNNNNYKYVCIITETDACDSDERLEETIDTLDKVLGVNNENQVDLISIRVNPPLTKNFPEVEAFRNRLVQLCQRVMSLKARQQEQCHHHEKFNDYKVVINDVAYLDIAIEAGIDGMHIKEKDVDQIPIIRKHLQDANVNVNVNMNANANETNPPPIIGTSCHSVESGVSNWKLYQPDYMFVGTCYLTQSHPEKNADNLEGPTLPGIVKQNIESLIVEEIDIETESETEKNLHSRSQSPVILAIGGIEMENCNEPVSYGADGVAVIRSVMQASDPVKAVQQIKKEMRGTSTDSN